MISVLLPTYNSGEYLRDSIHSILNQTYGGFELLVLDDGSNDYTENIVETIKDVRMQYHKLHHQGLTKTLNYGLSIAKYDIIARMDADDLCVPWRLEKQLSVLNNLPKNYLISSWYSIFENDKIDYLVKTPTESKEIMEGLLLYSFISHPGLMFNKNILLENGGYKNRVEIDAFQDYETWLAVKDIVEFKIIPEILVFQRYRKESLSNNLTYKQKIMYEIQEPYYVNIESQFGISNIYLQNMYRGWREYFYGNRKIARIYWNKMRWTILKHPRVIIAWFVTMLPEDQFVQFKESRLRFRIQYYLQYFKKEHCQNRTAFSLINAKSGK